MPTRLNPRRRMVDHQLIRRGISDELVLKAMATVPREFFVPDALANLAYDDGPLPIGDGQTISQPYIVALMIEALQLKGGERVLEVGAGSGYAAAILAQIASEVIAIERIAPLAQQARTNLSRAGCTNVHVHCGDGSVGWMDREPYDAILVSAGAPEIPEALKQQLAVGGRLAVPAGARQTDQHLYRVLRKGAAEYETADLGAVHFVPLIGEAGWSGPR